MAGREPQTLSLAPNPSCRPTESLDLSILLPTRPVIQPRALILVFLPTRPVIQPRALTFRSFVQLVLTCSIRLVHSARLISHQDKLACCP
nr:hypothetical protein Iba_chr03bCG5610 [Ipomoea batatas]